MSIIKTIISAAKNKSSLVQEAPLVDVEVLDREGNVLHTGTDKHKASTNKGAIAAHDRIAKKLQDKYPNWGTVTTKAKKDEPVQESSYGSAVLNTAINSPKYFDREMVATHPSASHEQLEQLSNDSHAGIRFNVVRHPNTSMDTLVKLANDPDRIVRKEANKKLMSVTAHEEHQLDEVSDQTLKSYIKANVEDQVQNFSSQSFNSGKKGDIYNKAESNSRTNKREKNLDLAMDKLAKSKMRDKINEKMNRTKSTMKQVINDFEHSDAPQFKGKGKEDRIKMAIAAKMKAGN